MVSFIYLTLECLFMLPTGSLYWKQNARKILAVSEEFLRFQQETKRKRPRYIQVFFFFPTDDQKWLSNHTSQFMMETEVDKNINLNVSCHLLTLMFQYTV